MIGISTLRTHNYTIEESNKEHQAAKIIRCRTILLLGDQLQVAGLNATSCGNCSSVKFW